MSPSPSPDLRFLIRGVGVPTPVGVFRSQSNAVTEVSVLREHRVRPFVLLLLCLLLYGCRLARVLWSPGNPCPCACDQENLASSWQPGGLDTHTPDPALQITGTPPGSRLTQGAL